MPIKMFLLTVVLFLLAACGQPTTPRTSTATENRISGLVLTDAGPVSKASIEVQDSTGSLVAKTELTTDSGYSVNVPATARYPLLIIAHLDGNPAPLKAAVINPEGTEQDVSPVSTLVVDTAMSLGGLTDANLAKAAVAAIHHRKTGTPGGTSATQQGDPTKHYGGWH